jgi:hypothetical protein
LLSDRVLFFPDPKLPFASVLRCPLFCRFSLCGHDQFLSIRANTVLTGSWAMRMTECGRPCHARDDDIHGIFNC